MKTTIIPQAEQCSGFEQDWQRGLTADEFKAEMRKRIDKWQEK
jgi:hypothetical protein